MNGVNPPPPNVDDDEDEDGVDEVVGTYNKAPPHLTEDCDYLKWKSNIDIWCMCTKTPKNERGPVVFLSLHEKAQDKVRKIQKQLGAKNGLKLLMDRLDSLYMNDKNTRSYHAFKEFHGYKRDSGESIQDFVAKFEALYDKLEEFQMVLPEGVKAYYLLAAANISVEDEKLARATVGELTYENMQARILNIYSGPTVLQDIEVPPVKEEVFYSSSKNSQRKFVRSAKNERSQRTGNPRGKDGNLLKCFGCDSESHLLPDCPNRMNRQGETARNSTNGSKCFSCGSSKHFIAHCPEKSSSSRDNQYQIHLTLIGSGKNSNSGKPSLLPQAFGMAILDSGCTKTVAGRVWMEEYLSTLSVDESSLVEKYGSNSLFRFGDGIESPASEVLKIPVTIGKSRYMVIVDVVENRIPFLFSGDSMKRADVVMDFTNDKALFCGEVVDLIRLNTGHYGIPLTKFLLRDDIEPKTHITLLSTAEKLKKMSREDKLKKAVKLHRQFSHATDDKLINLTKSSLEFDDEEFIDCIKEAYNLCKVCEIKRPVPLRPVVGMPPTMRFNELISMDLKQIEDEKEWILHITDCFARYSASAIVNSKKKEVIASCIFKIWIAYFGVPRKILSDNGGEFSNEEVCELAECLGITVTTTAVEAPFSNGIVERGNRTLYEAFWKTSKDVGCSKDVALAWATSAKNALESYQGYCPNQLVFGRNINLPSVLTDKLPAISRGNTFASDVVRENLNALHSARENFIAAESSEKIKRALSRKTRTYADVIYNSGDSVFYRRKDSKVWRGPGVVIGLDGKIVVIKHQGQIYRVHACQVMKDHDEGCIEPKTRFSKTVKDHGVQTESEIISDAEIEIISDDAEGFQADQSDKRVGDSTEIQVETVDADESRDTEIDAEESRDTEIDAEESRDTEIDAEVCQDIKFVPDEQVEEEFMFRAPNVIIEEIPQQAAREPANERPMVNKLISYQFQDGEVFKATVLSRQPKKNSKFSNWLNVLREGENKPVSINMDDVVQWQEILFAEHTIFFSEAEEMKQEVVDAKQKELQNMIEHDVYTEVENTGQDTISMKWVFTEKVDNGERRTKARLVARGFEEHDENYRTDSPTCKQDSLRLVLFVIANNGWELHSLDISAAFLQGDKLKRTVFLRPPLDVCTKSNVWKLKRCIYGLKDAPREWYKKLAKTLQGLGAVVSKFDYALFIWYSDKVLHGILCTHVDDLIYGGTPKWHETVMRQIAKIFKISRHESGIFRFIGMSIYQRVNDIQIDQSGYVNSLQEIEISPERLKLKHSLLDSDEKSILRSKVGQVQYAASHTRVDMAFDACNISNYGKEPTVNSLILTNKAIRKMKGNEVKLKFCKLGKMSEVSVLCFSDATYASLPSGASQGAYLIFLSNPAGRVVPISWQSKKLSRVTKIPLASETLALCEVAEAGNLISFAF